MLKTKYNETPIRRRKNDGTLRIVKELAQNPNITIALADKNLGIVIMDTDRYKELINKHLSSGPYEILPANERDAFVDAAMKELNKIISAYYIEISLYKHGLQNINFLIHAFQNETEKWEFPYLYATIKVHKLTPETPINPTTPLSMRPIVASHHWITRQASILIAEILQPIADTLPDVLKDSRALIQQLEGKQFPPTAQLVSFDIVNFYGNIDVDEVRQALYFFNYYQTNYLDGPHIPEWTLIMIRWVLLFGAFTFDDVTYRQTRGMPMGTNMAVPLANIFGHALFTYNEYLFTHLAAHPQEILDLSPIKFYRRYIDDMILVIDGDGNTVQRIFNLFNAVSDNIKLTIAKADEDTSILAVLDLAIKLIPSSTIAGMLECQFKCYQKPLNKYTYITDISCHPKNLKRGFIKGELIRYARNSSTLDDFRDLRATFRRRLNKRGYTNRFLDQPFAAVNYNDRPAFVAGKPPTEETILPFVIRQSSHISDIKLGPAIHALDPLLERAFLPLPMPRPMLALKSNPAIGRMLTRQKTNSLSVRVPAFNPMLIMRKPQPWAPAPRNVPPPNPPVTPTPAARIVEPADISPLMIELTVSPLPPSFRRRQRERANTPPTPTPHSPIDPHPTPDRTGGGHGALLRRFYDD